MSKLGTEGEDIIGVWSEDKLNLLEKYIKAYSIIMNRQKETWLKAYYYVDAFAGSIRPRAKDDEQRYISGSPLRALQTEPPFDYYWFIDISPQRIERIEKLKKQFPRQNIIIYYGDCNEILRNQLIPQIPYNTKKRAFVFLDPYGLQVTWETIEHLANTKTCDLFINFSVMGITRILPKDKPPTSEAIKLINNVMGNSDWINELYKPPTYIQTSLFPEPNNQSNLPKRETIKAEWLAKLYTQQLGSLFKYVSEPVLMKNSTNSTLYALCLASHNEKAIKITNDIFKRYEQLK